MTSTSQSPPTLGRCPTCATVIASLDVRVRERPNRRPTLLARCPRCRRSVNPE